MNETFPQSLSIAEDSAAVLSLAPPGGLVERWQGSAGQVTWREEEPLMQLQSLTTSLTAVNSKQRQFCLVLCTRKPLNTWQDVLSFDVSGITNK